MAKKKKAKEIWWCVKSPLKGELLPIIAANYSWDEPMYTLGHIYGRSLESLEDEGYRLVKIEVREV